MLKILIRPPVSLTAIYTPTILTHPGTRKFPVSNVVTSPLELASALSLLWSVIVIPGSVSGLENMIFGCSGF